MLTARKNPDNTFIVLRMLSQIIDLSCIQNYECALTELLDYSECYPDMPIEWEEVDKIFCGWFLDANLSAGIMDLSRVGRLLHFVLE